MQYRIRHTTRFSYTSPISESALEVRMQPRSDVHQRCLHFELTTQPRARVFAYQDALGNIVHHFDIPSRHTRLAITAEAVVEMTAPPVIPNRLGGDAWAELDSLVETGEYVDSLGSSRFLSDSALLGSFANELRWRRAGDPLPALRRLTSQLFDAFDYAPRSTRVDSPIDEALRTRAGVCQDFAHIMIALVRTLGIPCRYVSGYLSPSPDSSDRSAEGATHAWVEACLPQIGWVGFDPTNNVLAAERHIRVAVGRDYADVPPTRGVFHGEAGSELAVSVNVSVPDAPLRTERFMPVMTWVAPESANLPASADQAQQQQQQQQ